MVVEEELHLPCRSRQRGHCFLQPCYQHLLCPELGAEVCVSLALRVYAYRVAVAVAAMAVPLGGLDALVFTAGVGEHSAEVRARVCAHLGFLGVALDAEANAAASPDADVAASASSVRVVILHAREELVVARAVRSLLR